MRLVVLQRYLFVTDNCEAIVADLNKLIGGGRNENKAVVGGAGRLYCKSDAQSDHNGNVYSQDCSSDAWYLTQKIGHTSPTSTPTSTATTTVVTSTTTFTVPQTTLRSPATRTHPLQAWALWLLAGAVCALS